MKLDKRVRILAGLLALGQLTCHQAIFTAPAGSDLTLSANPEFVAAHGGVSVVTALVLEPTGAPVADGTVVQFFTNLGTIQEQGRTNDGVARVNFVSDTRSGEASVTAFSGEAQGGPIKIKVGAIRPTTVFLTANPPAIPANSRSTHIVATVLDQYGNPVPNIPVIFQVVSGGGLEFMESRGEIRYTDNDGRVEDILRTRRPFGTVGPPAIVEVTVLAPGPVTPPQPQTQIVVVPIE